MGRVKKGTYPLDVANVPYSPGCSRVATTKELSLNAKQKVNNMSTKEFTATHGVCPRFDAIQKYEMVDTVRIIIPKLSNSLVPRGRVYAQPMRIRSERSMTEKTAQSQSEPELARCRSA